MPTIKIHRRSVAALAAVLAGAASLSACGSSSESSSGSGPDISTLSQEGQARLELLYEGSGTSPATEAPKPEAGKDVWFIASGMSLELIAASAQGFEDAAEAVGWNAKVVDGKFQPSLWLTGIEQAIAARADGIVLYALDCAAVRNGLEAAKKARIPVVGVESEDCDPSLETVLTYADGDFPEFARQLGADQALWAAASANGKGTIIELRETDAAITLYQSDGVAATLEEECPDCKHVTVEFTAPEIGPALQQKVEQAILKNPDAIGMLVPYDDLLVAGVSSAIVSSGRGGQIKVISVGGTTAAFDLMRQNRGLNADIVFDPRWEGFAAVDWMNRLLHGETPTGESAPTGIGQQLVEQEDVPKEGKVAATVDYEAIYLESWGVDG
ncbi:sugar ABC transporter substrate-binding protein [Nocardioides antri]|uniref:sugar ABC transporter substrate-binding protein n=1 Tax=Nocardioides antri TaxID=2607659 RepID=UPI00165F3395|nr:substrate-binding domain-containing protein [Nocardioides antri]